MTMLVSVILPVVTVGLAVVDPVPSPLATYPTVLPPAGTISISVQAFATVGALKLTVIVVPVVSVPPFWLVV